MYAHVVSLNVRMLFNVSLSLKSFGTGILEYMIIHSSTYCDNEFLRIFVGNKKDIAKAFGCSEKTILRHIKKLEDSNLITKIKKECWSLNFPFCSDEEFEEITEEEPHSCFMFVYEDENKDEDDDEDSISRYNRLMKQWNELQPNKKSPLPIAEQG